MIFFLVFQICFRSVDDDISEILKDIPPNSMVIVALSSGYFPPDILKYVLNNFKVKCLFLLIQFIYFSLFSLFCFSISGIHFNILKTLFAFHTLNFSTVLKIYISPYYYNFKCQTAFSKVPLYFFVITFVSLVL